MECASMLKTFSESKCNSYCDTDRAIEVAEARNWSFHLKRISHTYLYGSFCIVTQRGLLVSDSYCQNDKFCFDQVLVDPIACLATRERTSHGRVSSPLRNDAGRYGTAQCTWHLPYGDAKNEGCNSRLAFVKFLVSASKFLSS